MSGRHPEEPVRLPVNRQTWRHLSFLHFRYDAAEVQRLVPEGLRVQQWGGSAWVGLTPFLMQDVRVPGLPPPPGWGEFAELNVRTYVQGPDGRDGLWFLGMLVPGMGFLLALRSIGLPYSRAGGAGELTAPLRWVGLPPPAEVPMVHASPGVATRLGMPRPAAAHRV